MSELFIRRPVMTILVMVGIIVFGIVAYRTLPISDLPTVDYPTISVNASLAGASPETMPKVGERGVPHGTFTDHWIRVVKPGAPPPTVARTGNSPIEPFFDRDKTGPEAGIYQGMGGIVYATLATNTGALAAAAATLDKALGADTTRGEAHFLLGVAYAQLGKTADAIRALEHAVRIDSGRPDRLRALAQAYERAGRDPATIDHLYRRALSLQPALAWLRADYADYLQGHGLIA